MLRLLRTAIGTPNPPATLTVESEVLAQERRVYLQLPDDHALSGRSYPILLVLDGEWNFELARAHAQFYSEFPTMGVEIPKLIVVGIENVDRDRDYVPTPDRREKPQFPTAGQADRFLQFLRDELFPFLEQNFRAAPNRTIAGWSFGGLLALHAAVAMPELFSAYLCIGPSGWWENDLTVDRFKNVRFERPTRMVITLGSEEVDGPVYDSTRRLLSHLEANPIRNLQVTHFEFDGVGHGGGVPLALGRGLRALFPGYRMQIQDDTTLADVKIHYQTLTDTWGFDTLPTAWVLQTLAARHWAADRREEAVEALEWYTDQYPHDALTHAYHGIYLMRLGHLDAAHRALRVALDLELARDVPSGVALRGIRARLAEAEASISAAGSDCTSAGGDSHRTGRRSPGAGPGRA